MKALAFLTLLLLVFVAYVTVLGFAAWQIWAAGLRWEAAVVVVALLGVSWNIIDMQRKSPPSR